MGSAIGKRLRQGGIRVVTALEGRGDRTLARAAAAGLEDLGSLPAAVRQADLLLSILPPGRALDLAEAVGQDAGPLYVDCNAVSPATARTIGALVGDRYVDAGIIGAPASPRLYACGPHAVELAALPLDIRVMDGEIGHASALKMCYAALTKGLAALLTESMVAADMLGIADALRSELTESQPQFLRSAEGGLPAMVPKAYRWIAEMQEIAATFAGVGLTPLMLHGAADVYSLVDTARSRAAGAAPENLDAVVAELRRALAPLPPPR